MSLVPKLFQLVRSKVICLVQHSHGRLLPLDVCCALGRPAIADLRFLEGQSSVARGVHSSWSIKHWSNQVAIAILRHEAVRTWSQIARSQFDEAEALEKGVLAWGEFAGEADCEWMTVGLR